MISFGLSGCGSGDQELESGSCTIVKHDDGSASLVCPDGTETTIPALPEDSGTHCSVQDNDDGTYTLSCDDGTEISFSDGVDGIDGRHGTDGDDGASCTIEENEAGQAQILCGDDAPLALPAGKDCKIEGNYRIDDARDLLLLYAAGCTEIAGSLIIGNTDLPSLQGLESLESIGDELVIENNDNLTNLQGLENLTSIGGDLSIRQNNVLPTCAAQNLVDAIGEENIEGPIEIANNDEDGVCD